MDQPLRAAIYARVSTTDQHCAAQLEQLRPYCAARGWSVTEEIEDQGFSGGNDARPGLKLLLALARTRKIDVIVVAKLDRLARSLRHLTLMVDEFTTLRVQFVSLGDQIDLDTASGKLMLHMIGAFAEFERALIRERTRAGLAHAKARGKRLGRPRLGREGEIRALRAKGQSYREIKRDLGVSMGSIFRALKEAN